MRFYLLRIAKIKAITKEICHSFIANCGAPAPELEKWTGFQAVPLAVCDISSQG
jgi:hypothetical protein